MSSIQANSMLSYVKNTSQAKGMVCQATSECYAIKMAQHSLKAFRSYRDITIFVFSHAARATCRRGHLCELVLFLFMIEGMELPDAEDRLSVGPVVVKI